MENKERKKQIALLEKRIKKNEEQLAKASTKNPELENKIIDDQGKLLRLENHPARYKSLANKIKKQFVSADEITLKLNKQDIGTLLDALSKASEFQSLRDMYYEIFFRESYAALAFTRKDFSHDQNLREAAKRMGWVSGKRGKGNTFASKIITDMYKQLTLPDHSGPELVFKYKGKNYSSRVSKEVAIGYLTERWGFASERACYSFLKKHKVKGLPSTWKTEGKYKSKN